MRTVALFILSIGLFAFSCESQPPLSDIDPKRQTEVSAVTLVTVDSDRSGLH